MKILRFINVTLLKVLSDVAYFLLAVFVFRLVQYAFDEIDVFKFASYLFCITIFHEDFYNHLIYNILFKLFPDILDDDEDEETDITDNGDE